MASKVTAELINTVDLNRRPALKEYLMYDIEDEIKIFEEREAAYDKGLLNGVLFGIPIGTIGTILIAWLTADTWLNLIK